MKFQKSLIAVAAATALLSSAAFASNATQNVIVEQSSHVTGVSTVSDITLNAAAIQAAIDANNPINFTVARACAFTNQTDGDFKLTPTAGANFLDSGSFALYNATLGKAPITLAVTSTTDAGNYTALSNATEATLTDHADADAAGTTCTNNEMTLRGTIPVSSLRTMKPGTYQFVVALAASNYTG